MTLNFDELQAALSGITDQFHLSEWHGILTGLICAGPPKIMETWVGELASQGAVTGLKESQLIALHSIYTSTMQQVEDESFSFEPLLPDTEPLNQRVAALGAWCKGLLYGLSVAGVTKDTVLSDESKELLADFVELTKAEFDDASSQEDDEFRYQELVEYIRVGALYLREDLVSSFGGEKQSVH